MIPFELLIAVSLGVAFLALVRFRPGTFIIAGNQATTLLALLHFQRYGQPASQSFLPGSLFEPRYLEIASNAFAIVTALLVVSVLWRPKKRPPADPRSLPAVPRPLVWAILAYFAVAFAYSPTIATSAYENAAWTIGGVNLGGLNAFLNSLLIYEAYRRTALGRWRPWVAAMGVFLLFFCTDYLKGSTGLASGYIAVGLVLLLSLERRRGLRLGMLLGAMAAMILVAGLVRSIRQDFHERGSAALDEAWSSWMGERQGSAQTAEGIEYQGNGTQYACHVLECIALYEEGMSRGWRSIVNPVIYTFEPSFLLEPLGLERPLDAPWELGRHYIHGGGIYIVGDLYWNGGYLCVLLIGLLIVALAYTCDTRYLSSAGWLMVACQFSPGLLQGMGYGFAQIFRGGFNGILAMAMYWLLSRVRTVSGFGPRAGSRGPRAGRASQLLDRAEMGG